MIGNEDSAIDGERNKPRLELEITDSKRRLVESRDFSAETSWFVSASLKSMASKGGSSGRGEMDSCMSSASREIPVVYKSKRNSMNMNLNQ